MANQQASSLIQVLVTGEDQQKKWEGRDYTVQECECLLLNDDGSVQCVGVLRLSDKFKGDAAPKPGTYSAGFTLVANSKDRKIGAVVTTLTPVAPRKMTPTAQS